jgi:sialate O-acetylesterase
MVLQQGMPVPIWGTAAPGEKVTVKFRDQTKTADADAQGKWMVKLDPLQLGDPGTMTITGANTLTLEDVLVGDVWVGSGQSNMDMGVSSYVKGDEVLAQMAAETYPKIRLIRCGRKSWEEATPQSIPPFSALLFSFGVPLQKELNVPLGLMVGAVGGTPSGMWVSEEAFNADTACKEAVAKFAATYNFEDAKKKYDENLEKWQKLAADAKQQGKKEPGGKPRAPLPAGECDGKFGTLYKVHIRPFIPFAIRGVLWDQGESGTAVQGVDQYTMMGALIRGWRTEWGQGDFPFIHVQKPSGGGCAWDPADPVTNKAEKFVALPAGAPSGNNAYFENHIRLNQYPNTFMAMAGDLGSGIHPSNKSGYGARACRVALGAAYGKKIEYYGPVYQSHKVEDAKVRVSFTHIGQGLAFRNGEKLQGFAVAGEDKVFQWADATIDGETVVLSCEKVAKPFAVRYAWTERRAWANLFNKDGLPAIPFRTDSW